MKLSRHYVIALTAGSILGLLAIVTIAIGPFFESQPWQISPWDKFTNFKPGPMLALEHEAVMLRLAEVMLSKGPLILAISIFLTCTLARVDELGKSSRWFWCLSKSMFLSIAAISVFSLILGVSAGQHNSEVPSYLEARILESYFSFLLFFVWSWISGIAPIFCVLVFLRLWFLSKNFKGAAA